MGESTDQLRQEVDQKRDDASQKIEQIEQQVMQTAQQMEEKVSTTARQIEDKVMDTRQQIEDKVTGTVQQMKDKIDWRGQVEDRPLVAVGVALLGGAVLAGVLKGGDNESHHGGASASGSGVGNAIRRAARDSGFEDTIQEFANAAFTNIGNQVRGMAERSLPGVADLMRSDGSAKSSASGMSGSSSMMGSSSPSGTPMAG
jgi:ElaB/YqjD/DUF883 family membrane-anchored ribosome-binding protein